HIHSSSLLPLPRPPTPHLFPYTTLFRSDRRSLRRPRAGSDQRVDRQDHPRAPDAVRSDDGSSRGCGRALDPPVMLDTHGLTREKDRKSTRLNSSHLGISYAVFCLKKKKK